MKKTKNLFVSHVHEDDKVVGDLKSLLKKNGYSVRDSSIDSSNPNQANDEGYIKSEILGPRIRWAGAMIVLVSPDTHKSEWVNWEIEYAHKNDTRIVGVWAQGAKESDVPENLDKYADAVVGWQGKAVMNAVTGKTNNWETPDGSIRSPRNIDRHNC